MNARQILESEIIGRALVSSSDAVRACDVLSPQNFSEPELKNIFTIIHSRAGEKPTESIVITMEYHRIHGIMKASLITQLCGMVSNSRDMFIPCLMLLEMDIREKMIDLFIRKESKFKKSQNLELAAAMKQCRDHLADVSIDIFEAVDAVFKYAKSYLEDESDDIAEIFSSIPKRASKIRQQSRTNHLMDTLTAIADTKHGHTLRVLKDAFLLVLQSGQEIPQHILEATHLLESKIYA
jgi:replicative DNA helicase